MDEKPSTYALYPGLVYSQSDGQRHRIQRNDLARLYGVRLADCITIAEADTANPGLRGHVAYAATLIALRPRSDGNYTLPAPGGLLTQLAVTVDALAGDGQSQIVRVARGLERDVEELAEWPKCPAPCPGNSGWHANSCAAMNVSA
ncbi:hypothetical protein [Massilia sp. TSP1-1-2]|uniref:hypothetical protein n=1 Tax=Massilia sp. TSP1-1-2 TaxID=2804649 RepID=UPI003CE968F6